MLAPSVSQSRRFLLLGAVVLLILLTAGLGWMAHVSRQQLQRSAEGVLRTVHIETELTALKGALVDTETGQRGYMLTGRPEYLEPYRSGSTEWIAIKARIEQLLVDGRAKAEFAALQPMIRAKLEFVKETVELFTAGKKQEAQARVLSGQGKALMDTIRRQVDKMQELEETLLRERQAAEALHARQHEIVSWGLFLMASIGVGAALFSLRRLQKTQELIRMCAFSRTLDRGGEWISVEQFLEERFNMVVSHGISPGEAERYFRQRSSSADLKFTTAA